MAKLFALTSFAVLALGAASWAAEPRSAIPWLSESVRNPVLLEPVKNTGPGDLAASITASSLSDIDRDSLGLIPPQVSGLPADLWGSSNKDLIVGLISAHPQGGVPATRKLFRQILLASTNSPDAQPGVRNLLLARIDRLLDIGALDEAEALLNLAGVTDQASYRRMVDIGLLTGRADPVCAKFAETPNLAPTLPIRVFCLARASDWTAAALTLSLGIAIGAIPQDQGELLTMFLDPQLFDDGHEPALPANLSSFDFVIREALALPRPAENLPAAFLQVDLVRDTPMRIRIEAAEKLVRTGAISHTQLFAAYRAGKPGASGGVWDRAAAAQNLDQALALGDRQRIANAFEKLNDTATGLALSVAIAEEYAVALSRLQPGDDSQAIFNAMLLTGDAATARSWLPKKAAANALLLLQILDSQPTDAGTVASDPFQSAIVAAFSDPGDISEHGLALLATLAEGGTGEAILGALAKLAESSQDPRELTAALHVLSQAGLDKHARRIAVETLLSGPGGF